VKVGAPLMDVDTPEAGPVKQVPKPAASKPAEPKAALSATPAPAAAVETFKLADIGEGIAEVTVTEWFVKEGDKVKEMDNLCAVESDKASVELTSPFTGVVKKLYSKENDVVAVGSPLVDIETAAKSPPVVSPPAPAATPAAMAPTSTASVKDFKLADIGEGIAEVTLTEWFVKEGDMVKEMDNLCGVESDKASVELTSPHTGMVKKLHHKEGATVAVGATLVGIEVHETVVATAPAPVEAVSATIPIPVSSPVPSAAAGVPSRTRSRAPGVLATPIVRALASEKCVDLNQVAGTGAMGRVLREDVLAALAASAAETSVEASRAAAAPVEKAAPVAATFAKTASPLVFRPPVRNLDDQVVEITSAVGKGMVKSMKEALKMPYMALGEEIDVTDLITMQKALKPIAEKQYGTKVSMTAFFIKAISLALYEYPIINSKFKDGSPASYTQFGAHNITVAIDSKNGLMVPNIKDVGNLSVLEIQQEVMRLAKAAQANKLSMQDMTKGTITFSNVGTIGTKDPRPIPFDGQAVIGAAGRLMLLPRYNSKMEIVPRQIMNVRWVGDHRHLDGATLARFSNSFKRLVENPGEWTLTLK